MKLKKNDLTTLIKKFEGKCPSINELLIFCTENKCSDLYIKVGECPYITRYGTIYRLQCYKTTGKIWREWAEFAITSENNAKYVRSKMLDFSYVIPANKIENSDEDFRYRVSAGFSNAKNIATFRMISQEPPSFSNISFPSNISSLLKQISERKNKITVFVGATGSGKTTTMAACMNDFSKNNGPFKNSVIISLEDPIEYIYNSTDNTKFIQKELGIDFKDYPSGVKQSLREHPTFVNVGETRDKETINTLIEASRTGHAVFTSFHAIDVSDTISRLYNQSCSDGNNDIMYDLISNMNIIICQRIEANGEKFVLNIQYMLFTPQIVTFLNDMIEKGKNIPFVINKLFKNKELIESGVLKDWD